jgi:hypothetical protein
MTAIKGFGGNPEFRRWAFSCIFGHNFRERDS